MLTWTLLEEGKVIIYVISVLKKEEKKANNFSFLRMASSVDVPATIQEDDEVVAKSFLALSFISREREIESKYFSRTQRFHIMDSINVLAIQEEDEHTDDVSRKFLAKWNKPLLHI